MGISKQLTGEYGKKFIVSTLWVKENDPEVYKYLHSLMVDFVDDKVNRTYCDDLTAFEEGDWLVEYVFVGYGESITEILITAGRDTKHIANQPAWLREVVEEKDLKDYWEVDVYLQMV